MRLPRAVEWIVSVLSVYVRIYACIYAVTPLNCVQKRDCDSKKRQKQTFMCIVLFGSCLWCVYPTLGGVYDYMVHGCHALQPNMAFPITVPGMCCKGAAQVDGRGAYYWLV